jgi:hypothetical protein
MSTHNITVEGGSSVRLPTAGKYCDRDIIVTATGGGGSTEPDPRADYQRVEYIASDGNQYIVTDFVADDNTCGIEAVIAVGNYNSTATMGSRENSGNTRFYLPYPLGSTSVYYGFNAAPKVTATVSQTAPFRWQTNFINSRLAGVYTFDGASVGSAAITENLTPHTVPVAIFGLYSGVDGGVTSAKNMKLYSARCSKGFDVVREYIPCYRKSDGEVGLYEKFTGQFLTNASDTGAFTKGADVEWE